MTLERPETPGDARSWCQQYIGEGPVGEGLRTPRVDPVEVLWIAALDARNRADEALQGLKRLVWDAPPEVRTEIATAIEHLRTARDKADAAQVEIDEALANWKG